MVLTRLGKAKSDSKIYKINKREDILNNFVKEAISKIEIRKYFESNKRLPPFPK